jgi:hypothetical protein
MVIKSTLGLNLFLFAPYLLVTTPVPSRRRALLALGIGPVLGLGVILLYNAARFGHPFTSGYDPTVDNFSTPLLVGLYGQLASSGKSVFLYAPLGFAALWGISGLVRHHRPEAVTALLIFATNVCFHARFASWAGEGSWGPRYLVPFLPFLLLPAAELWQSGRRWRRRAFALALALGLLVQIGGTAIYFGSYMRAIGEYPYERPFSDPLFMVRSHFVPNYSPVVGHWRLLARNVRPPHRSRVPAAHRPRGDADPAARLPIAEEDQAELPNVIDFWFCYLLYAGIDTWLVVILVTAAGAGGAVGMAVAIGVHRRNDDPARPGLTPEPLRVAGCNLMCTRGALSSAPASVGREGRHGARAGYRPALRSVPLPPAHPPARAPRDSRPDPGCARRG